jgi:hypothetical protein
MKKCLFFVLPLTLTLWSLWGCTSSVRYSPDEIKDYPPALQEQIRQGNVAVGMTPQQVRYAWGPPTTVNVLAPTQEGRPREEWIYSTGIFVQRRLLFVDGKLFDIFPEAKSQPQQQPQQPLQQEPQKEQPTQQEPQQQQPGEKK